jgi:hypothetical protein
MRKKPYLQGALDSLCAVYAIVNSAKIIAETTEEEDIKLFNDILFYLQEKDLLAKSLTDGITIGLVGSILKDVAIEKIPDRYMPFKQKPSIHLDDFWDEITDFLKEKNRAVLMAINGYSWDHWSVVSNINENQIFFFDSRKLRSFLRSRCTTIKATKNRPHLLCATHTYFLSKECKNNSIEEYSNE